jgi:hypothetical protein
MNKRIKRTFALLPETDRKLEEMTRNHMRGTKSATIDYLVSQAYNRQSELTQEYQNGGEKSQSES